MDNELFVDICRDTISKRDDVPKKDVFVSWLSKAAENNKALLGVKGADNNYYECTYSGKDFEIYVDVYVLSSHEKLGLYNSKFKDKVIKNSRHGND